MKTLIVLTTAGLLGPFLLAAQSQPPAPDPTLMRAMYQYVNVEIVPVLKASQGAFDEQLPTSDLAFIREQRTAAAALREKGKVLHLKIKEAREAGKAPGEMEEQFRDVIRNQREDLHVLMVNLHPFLERNREVLHLAMDGLKPHYDQWVEAQKAILEEYRPAEVERPLLGPPLAPGLFGLMPPAPGGASGHPALPPPHPLAIAFVLWDGQTPPLPTPTPGNQPETGARQESPGLMQNFPNPATGNTVIRFRLPAVAGRAILKVADAQGRIVRTLDLGRIGAGLHEVELDVSSLESGIYSYTLEAGEFLETRKMMVKQ